MSFWQTKRVLVTGGAGFIGSHLVELLIEAGAAVTVLDTFKSGSRENLAQVADRVDVREIDVRNIVWEDLLSAEQFDVIFHYAANAYVPPSVENPTYDFQVNFETTFRLLESLRKLKWPGVMIFASSAAVYGNARRIPISEDDLTVPISPYGVGKLSAERYVAVFSQLYGLKMASLRFFSSYGPRQRKQVVYDLIERIIANPKKLFIYGDGTQVRDFVFVEDTARSGMVVVEHGTLQGEVYNVGSGQECTIGQLADGLCEVLDMHPEYDYSGAVRPGDPEKLSVDITRLKALGFEPQVGLAEGLRRTVEWYYASKAESLVES